MAISFCLISQQQPKTDSLNAIINSASTHDTIKVSTYVSLAHELRWIDIKRAVVIANKGLNLSKK
ncbi:MAG TPA: hypothetical protein VN698_14720 [Bacteroidia bacterium]|nr:hypothetical protein [Bacteroidia bacterium]